ncbi:MAG: EAL domain-containing protein [Xenococcaceae cyanobacterium]
MLTKLWQRRNWQRWRPRHLVVLLTISATTLVVSATVYLSYKILRGLILDNLKQNVLLSVQRGGDEIDEWLATRKAEVEAIANTPTLRSMDWLVVEPYLKSEVERLKDFYQIAMVNPDGSYYTTRVGEANANLKDRKHFQQAMAGQVYVSNPIISRTLGIPIVVVAAPVWSDSAATEEPIGIITGIINIDRVAEMVDSLESDPGSYAFALNSQGMPIVHPDPREMGNLNQPAPSFIEAKDPNLARIARQMVGKQRGIELLQIEGDSVYVAYLPLGEADWSMALVIPCENIRSQLKGLNWLATLVGGILAVATIVAMRQVHLSELSRTRAAEETLLNRLTGCIRASLDLEQILETTLEEVGTLLNLERAAFGWYDPQQHTFSIQREYYRGVMLSSIRRFEVKPDFEARLLLGEEVQLQETTQLKSQSYFALPVRTEKEPLGYLILVRETRWFWNQGEKELLQTIADELAIAITQSHLYTQIQGQAKRLALALDHAALVAITEPKGKITYVNDQFCQLSQYSREELIGQNYHLLNSDYHSPEFFRDFSSTSASKEIWKGEIKNQAKDGTDYWLDTTIFPFLNEKGIPPQYLIVSFDITQRKLAEEQLFHDAFHDKLTGLGNRALLMERLKCAIEQAKHCDDYQFAVLFLDLDRFKVINDSLGHLIGDQLLIAISRRLESCLHPVDTVARFGGDEFIILLDNVDELGSITKADQIQRELRSPFHLSGHEVFTSASIGITLSSPDYEQPEDLMRDADIAMYRAKAQGKAGYAVFNQEMHARAIELLRLEQDLRRAIERQEFQVHYQPIVALKTGKIIGFEALLYWQHPERGLVSPGKFMPVAEETRLIIPLGEWVLSEACRQLRTWQEQFSAPLMLSVNLSGIQLAQSDMMAQIDRILHAMGLDGQGLKLEITESVMMENFESAKVWLEQLRTRQIQVSIDDFGTGYSSLSYLHHFPIDTLKIDRSFVDSENLQIVQAIVTLAHSLGMDVIAEGVETQKQLTQLQELGCEYGQGYLFSRPLKCEAATSLLSESLA